MTKGIESLFMKEIHEKKISSARGGAAKKKPRSISLLMTLILTGRSTSQAKSAYTICRAA
jgi:hypothetical protein